MSPRSDLYRLLWPGLRLSYLIVSTALLAVILFVVALYELNRSRREVLEILSSDATSLIESITLSAENALRAFEELEITRERHLLQNARMLHDIDAEQHLSEKRLREMAIRNDIDQIEIFDRHGRSISGTTASDTSLSPDDLTPVLSGREEEDLFSLGHRFFAIVRREGGGAIALSDEVQPLDLRRTIGIGRLIQDIGDNHGIEYIVLQDEDGILIASANVVKMPKLIGDPFLVAAIEGDSVRTRITSFDGGETFEAVKLFAVGDVSYGLFRIGLSMEAVRLTESKVKRRIALVSFLLFGFVLATLSIIETRQRKDRMTAMGELASGVAHEIRNPLNAIGMIVQRFEREFVPTEDTEEYRALARTVRSEVDRVNAIIYQFLNFARPPKLHREPVDLQTFLEETVAVVASKAEARGIVLGREFDSTGILSLDREQMRQAVLNLLMNAIDATPAGGSITLRSIAGGKDIVLIEVIDTGSGIRREIRERIFDPYFTTKEEGTGMGLSLTHQIVAEHGGSIEVESEGGEGSVFRIRIPHGLK